MTSCPNVEVLPTSRFESPVSELDPFSDEALSDPWGLYAELQRLGSAVWLSKYEMFALTRYDCVYEPSKTQAPFRRPLAS
jgi:hypothetical protein